MKLYLSYRNSFLHHIYAALAVLVILFASNSNNSTTSIETEESILEVTASHNHTENLHLFEMSSNEIPAGWTTITFNNASPVDHFFVIYKVPDEAQEAADAAGDPLLEHWFQGVTEPFQHEFNPFHRGEVDYGEFVDNLVASISEKGPWFLDPGAVPMGGPGFTAPGRTSKNSVFLDPGDYVVECYVKDEDGQFHSYLGMLELLRVTNEESGMEEPTSVSKVTVSTTGGIQYQSNLEPGEQVIQFLFEDQDTYAHLLGHNVQLVRFDNEPDQRLLDDLSAWMNWANPEGLVNRAPDGAEFIGGTMEMTAGATTYFHANLEPGHYAWIAEIPNPDSHNMLKTFRIPRGHSNAR